MYARQRCMGAALSSTNGVLHAGGAPCLQGLRWQPKRGAKAKKKPQANPFVTRGRAATKDSGADNIIDAILQPPSPPKAMSEVERKRHEEATLTYADLTFKMTRREQKNRHRLTVSRLGAYFELPEERRAEADRVDLDLNPLMLFQVVDTAAIPNYSHTTRRRAQERLLSRKPNAARAGAREDKSEAPASAGSDAAESGDAAPSDATEAPNKQKREPEDTR